MRRYYIKVLRKLGLLKRFNLLFKKSLNNRQFIIPLISGNGEQNLMAHEEWMDEVLRKLIGNKPGAFIDVGVNVGQTLLKIKSINPDIEYYGFEPNPTCVYYINQLVEVNKFLNVQIFPVAVAEKVGIGELNFFFDSDTDSAATVIKDFRPGSVIKKKVYIPCFPFHDMAAYFDQENISTIKIDVEGAELEVLKGVSAFMNTCRPFIVIEILPVYQQSNQTRLYRQTEIETLVEQQNYKILRVKKTAENSFERFEPIHAIGIHGDQSLCDYVLCPEERIQNLVG